MTTQATIKKEVERIRQQVARKTEDVITVTLWRPDGKDKPYRPGDRFRILALKEPKL